MSENTLNKQLSQVSEVKLSYKSNIQNRISVTCSKNAYELFLFNWDIDSIEHRETFKVIFLNRRNIALGIMTVSEGGINGTIADPRIILQSAILANASSIILAHNHPSGSEEPSPEDLTITKKIKEVCKLIDIQLIDHIIITSDKFYSLADNADF